MERRHWKLFVHSYLLYDNTNLPYAVAITWLNIMFVTLYCIMQVIAAAYGKLALS